MKSDLSSFLTFYEDNRTDVFNFGIVDFLSRFLYTCTIVSSWNLGRELLIPMVMF